ncbi:MULTISPECIES: DUF397 domain-containing protein [Streptomyces]|uniref:DUF397 domain-containing protein n=1 Tax=Streptomyces evansiae TaxID=3075535 RepID=A0ABU2R8B9_9ACTN|nr:MULTISPECIES: DUF397 domain-containing protein [unclassified Streptomyces]MDT0412948.1 DUF397 domain-containing protein [Streptomyces sp. DSM 41979]MYQ57406.1 DUF397 domain-containing protein [Streptomyces sp. SID4926]SCE06149.1 protein of unknown function [Streptomyces sp. DfronAA-171]
MTDPAPHLTWFKSSYSNAANNCIEAAWFKSSYSSGAAQCVEAAPLPDAIAIRDSKDTALTSLRYPAPQWADFCAALAADAL